MCRKKRTHPSFNLACMLQVATEPVAGAVQAATTYLEALQLELCALERVDVNWVAAQYRAGTAIIEKDNRRITRPLLRMKPVRLCEQSILLPGSRRLYLVRSVFKRDVQLCGATRKLFA